MLKKARHPEMGVFLCPCPPSELHKRFFRGIGETEGYAHFETKDLNSKFCILTKQLNEPFVKTIDRIGL